MESHTLKIWRRLENAAANFNLLRRDKITYLCKERFAAVRQFHEPDRSMNLSDLCIMIYMYKSALRLLIVVSV